MAVSVSVSMPLSVSVPACLCVCVSVSVSRNICVCVLVYQLIYHFTTAYIMLCGMVWSALARDVTDDGPNPDGMRFPLMRRRQVRPSAKASKCTCEAGNQPPLWERTSFQCTVAVTRRNVNTTLQRKGE